MFFSGTINDFNELLQYVFQQRASDVHLMPKIEPAIRVDGSISPIKDYDPLTSESCLKLSQELLGDDSKQRYLTFLQKKEIDLSYEIQMTKQLFLRCRINMYEGLNGIYFAVRILPQKILSLTELNYPPVLIDLCRKEHGLIIISGPTGSGKTTTIAAMLDLINTERQAHILTLEDPIEYIHQPCRSIISQREILSNTSSFYQGLRAALREDPDVIFVGEIRDRETMETALTAAETGHLVLTTLHTASAIEAVDRIIQYFPDSQQKLAQVQLANCFEGIIAQRLLKKKNGIGRVAALEILTKVSASANLIRCGEAFRLHEIMRINPGMQVMQDAVEDLIARNIIQC